MLGGLFIATIAIVFAFLIARVVTRIILPERRAKLAARDRAIANAMTLWDGPRVPDQMKHSRGDTL
jgi:hypothetical protein